MTLRIVLLVTGILLLTAFPPNPRTGMILPGTSKPKVWTHLTALRDRIAPRQRDPALDPYAYQSPPSIQRQTYINAWCAPFSGPPSPACPEAGAMYDELVAAGLDPAVQYGQAYHETSLGRAGVGAPPIHNLHGVQCHAGDERIADSKVAWGNGCAAVYANYQTSVRVWARLILREYVAEGLDTPAKAVWKYAPPGKDGNDPPSYITSMQTLIDAIRARDGS